MARYRSEFGQANKIEKKKFRIRGFLQYFRDAIQKQGTLNTTFREGKFGQRQFFSGKKEYDYPVGVEKLFNDYLLIPKFPENEVERRVLYSEMVQLFYLLTSGELDHEPDLEKQVDLAYKFLELVNKKNKEEVMADLGHRGVAPITIGAEIKFTRKTLTTIAATTLDLTQAYDKEHNSSGNLEIATSPVASPRTFLREILLKMKLGWRPKQWIIHETLSVLLNPQHTEIMDVTAIQAAAGLLFPDDSPAKKYEKHEKISRNEEYYPFHKARSDQSDDDIDFYIRKDESHTEIRSIIKHDKIEFSRLVRQITFTYLASYGIQAVQKPPNERSPKEQELAIIFKNLLFNWFDLLEEVGINNPQSSEKMAVITDDMYFGRVKTEYHVLLAEIQRKKDNILFDDETFRERARTLIREYNREARKILKY